MKLVIPFTHEVVSEGVGRDYDVTFKNFPIEIHKHRRLVSGGLTGDPYGNGNDNEVPLEIVVENDPEINNLSQEEKNRIDDLTTQAEQQYLAEFFKLNPSWSEDWGEWDRDSFAEEHWFIKMVLSKS